jgi:hypothetical protein
MFKMKKNNKFKTLEKLLDEIQFMKVINRYKIKADHTKLALLKSYISIIPKLEHQKFLGD